MRMVSLFALAGIGLSMQAFAAPTLALSDDAACGGEVTVTVTDATNYRLVFGEAGAYSIPDGSCADTVLDVEGSASAPLSDSETTFVLNETQCGASAQVIDMDTCEVSAVVVLPTENAYDIGYEDGCVFAGGTWDADTETCLGASCAYTDSDDDTYDDDSFDAGAASVEESPQCFLSGFCQAADEYWESGLPNPIVGKVSELYCASEVDGGSELWRGGSEAAFYVGFVVDVAGVDGLGVCEE
jgi:hypothetical protein